MRSAFVFTQTAAVIGRNKPRDLYIYKIPVEMCQFAWVPRTRSKYGLCYRICLGEDAFRYIYIKIYVAPEMI